MPGRRPVPTALKILRGNPGKRALNKCEPRPPASAPACPRELNPIARKEWRRVVREMDALGMLTQLDRAALAMYAQAWAEWVESVEKLARTGYLIKAPSGYLIQNPFVSIKTQAEKAMAKIGIEFGMTPASRSKIEGARRDDAGVTNPFAELVG